MTLDLALIKLPLLDNDRQITGLSCLHSQHERNCSVSEGSLISFEMTDVSFRAASEKSFFSPKRIRR